MTEAEIKASYKEQHDNLTEDYYQNHLMSKEDFDYYHGQNWDDMDAELIAEGYLTLLPPPLCTHWAIIDGINLGNERPVRVKRIWDRKEYIVDCFATESVKDQYQVGDVAVGDYVMVEFLDDDPNRAVVFAKVFKTW